MLQLPHWSLNSLSSRTTEPPTLQDPALSAKFQNNQFLPKAFHFPPLQLTAQHILHSYRAGSAVCCKASNTMTRLRQPASGWEKHATEQERGFFVPKGLLIKCLTCHSAPGTAERAAVIQMFSVNQRSLSADRNRERQSLNVRVGAAQKQWDSYQFVLFLLGAAHLIASFEKHNGTDLLAVT